MGTLPQLRRRDRIGAAAAGAAPLLVAAGLRLVGLPGQVLVGDEYWDLLAALDHPVGELLGRVTFATANVSPPLASLYRALLDLGWPLGEMELRLPALASGLLAVALLPPAVRPWVGPRAARIFAWWLAVSPILVLFGRMVRAYVPMVLVASLAAVAFARWWERPRPGWAVLYVASVPLAIYLHLLAAPFALAPLGVAALACAARLPGAPEPRRLLRLGLATAAATAVALLPAARAVLSITTERSGTERPGLGAALEALHVHVGSDAALLVLPVAALAGRGLVHLLRERPRCGLYTLVLVLAQLVGLYAVAPFALHKAMNLARYSLPVLPVALLWVAVGTAASWPGLRGRAAALAPAGATALLLAGIAATGPLGDAALWRGSYGHARAYRPVSAPAWRLPPEWVPDFYRRLGESPGEGGVLEYPWQRVVLQYRPAALQRVHGRRVLLGLRPGTPLDDPRLALESYVPLRPEAVLASDARYLAVHLEPLLLERRIRGIHERRRRALAEGSATGERLRREAERRVRGLARRWGPPHVSEPRLRVWDLDRVRRAQRGG